MKTKLFLGAALLFAVAVFANEPTGGKCTLDPSGTCECIGYTDSNGQITGYNCQTAQTTPLVAKCVCP